MTRLKSYIWIFVLAASISAIVFSNTCCTGKASNKDSAGGKNNSAQVTKPVESKGVITLDEKTFDAGIANGVTLVDFWATWCGPCRLQAPIIDNVSADMSGKAAICKLDIDKNPHITEKYNIQSIPTLIIFKDGKIVRQFLGVTSKESLIAEINKYL